MKKIILIIAITLCSASYTYASNTFNCTIGNITSTNSAIDFVIVTMECSDTTNPITSGTNGCTGANIPNNTFTFNTNTSHGKVNLSLLMMAYSSNKRVYASTYATCPTQISNTPLLYSLKTFND